MSATTAPRAAELAWTVALVALGGLALSSGYEGWTATAALVGTAVAGILLVVLGRAVRLSTFVVTVVALTLLVLLVTVLLRSGDAPADARPWQLLADAVPRLVTGPRPAPAVPDLLAPGILLVGLVAVLVGVRTGRDRRHRASPLVGALVLYVAGTALTAGEADRWGLVAAALLVVTVAGWSLLGSVASGSGAVEGPVRQRFVAAGALAAVALPLVVAGALLDRADAFDPRTVVDPPVTRVVVANPLPQLDAWARDPERELFGVTGDVFPLHLAVLTDYDGAAWAAPSAFRPLGEADPVLPAGDRRARVVNRVTLVDLPRPWLPVSGSPQSVGLGSALVDADSGSLIDPRATSGTSYDVVGLVDAPDDATALAAALPDPVAVPAQLLAIPGIPEGLREYARSAVEGAGTPFARAKAIEAAVRGTRTLDPEAPGGSSYRRVQTFLLGEEGTSGAQAGGPEQFATSFAVLARAVGLPTRVVVGFTPGTDAVEGSPGTRLVRGRDALAWPEVYFAGAGWVPFSPTPEVAEFGPDVDDDAPIPSVPPTPAANPSGAVTVEVAAPPGAQRGTDLAPILVGTAAVLGAALLPLLVLGAMRLRLRAAHRRAGVPGAWAELLDVAHLADLRSHDGQDAREVATALDLTAGGSAARAVVRAAEHDAWAPDPSATTADAAWRGTREVARGVRRSLPPRRRLLWGVTPSVLRRPADGSVPVSRSRKVPPSHLLSEPGSVEHHGAARWARQVPADREG